MATKITTRVLADDAVTDAKIADVTLTTATQAASDNTTKIATTAYVTTAIANLADSAPSTLNTLNELAAALGDDANYATTTTNAIATKLPLAGGTLTGNVFSGNKTGLTDTNTGHAIAPGGLIYHTTDGTIVQSLNRLTDDGPVLRLVGNGTTAGSVGVLSGGLSFGTGTSLTTRMIINSSGNVGIGNNNPGELLSLYKSSGNTLVQAAVHANSTVGFEIKKTNATTQTWRIVDGQTVNGVLEFYDATNSATRMAIKGNGNVGINNSNPTAKLTITDEDAGQAMLQVRNYATGATGSFGNAHSAEFRSATSTTTHGMLIHHHENNIDRRTLDVADSTGVFASFVQGKLGIGVLTPDSLLHTKATNNSAGDLYTQIGPGNAPGIMIQNAGTTDSNHATIFFKNDSGTRAHIGAKFVNHSTEETNLTFGTTDSSGNARERLHLVTNTNSGADFIGHEGPNATSSTAGDNWHLVADRAMEVIQDNGNASSWITMKTFTLGANCKSLSIKWTAKNQSGSYYWAWRITRNGTVMTMVNHGGGNAQKSFSYGLASGESASVHAFRSYDVDVGEAYAGDEIKLEMINSSGGGTPVAGTQYLYCKQFLVTSLDKGKIYNGDRGTIRRPMIYGATQHVQYNGNEYDLGSFEFPFRMDSGTHNVVELAEWETGTTANATMDYVGLYGYAGRNMGQGTAMASTRRRSSNTDWEDIDGATVHSANGSNGGITHPDFYWADGVLKVGVSASLQITGRIRVTWRQATIQRHWNI